MSRLLTLEIKRRIKLDGAELDEYYAAKREEEKQAGTAARNPYNNAILDTRMLYIARVRLDMQRRSARVTTIHDSDSDSDDEAGPPTVAAATGDKASATTPAAALAVCYAALHAIAPHRHALTGLSVRRDAPAGAADAQQLL